MGLDIPELESLLYLIVCPIPQQAQSLHSRLSDCLMGLPQTLQVKDRKGKETLMVDLIHSPPGVVLPETVLRPEIQNIFSGEKISCPICKHRYSLKICP